MYDEFYGFTGRPFQLTPDPAFYFESGTHRKAMSYLGYGLAQGEGFIVITGDIGAGKTTLVGHLMATIDPRRLNAVKLVSTQVGGDDILRLAAQGFGIATDDGDKAALLGRIEAFLHGEARAGKRALLIVDEAQNLATDALEELRMLSNFQLGGQSLLQIFLLGQPEFREIIAGASALEQLRQRVIATHHLDPMQADEVAPYIEHRLRIVGWTGSPRFTTDAYQMLGDASAGVPRRLNVLVSRVLLLGAIDTLDIIDRRVVEAVLADSVTGEGLPPPVAESVADEIADEHVSTESEPELLLGFTDVDQSAPEGDATIPEMPAMTVTQDVGIDELQAIRAEVQALSAALARQDNAGSALPARIEAVEARLADAERRAGEQEEALRRVLSKLIEWAERDERHGPFTNRAA